ncbi:hypothetical protein SELMODRAFT_17503, partial [Selaginella moellendorffii]
LYKECVRNINAENGGEEVHDGCQKFTAAGKDGSPEALKCAACGCHRNFHQQESETPTAIKGSDLTQFADDILGVDKAQSPDDSTPKEKRKRTIFSAEQLTKLEALAESVHWSLGNIPKDQQASAAMEIGITVESLKYWFHNRK